MLDARAVCRRKEAGGCIDSRNLKSAAAVNLWKTFFASTSSLNGVPDAALTVVAHRYRDDARRARLAIACPCFWWRLGEDCRLHN